MAEMMYAAVRPDGRIVSVDRDVRNAAEKALRTSPTGNAIVGLVENKETRSNPGEKPLEGFRDSMAMDGKRAFALSKLPRVDFDEVRKMTDAQAMARLAPYFQYGGKAFQSDLSSAAKQLLSANAKTVKADAIRHGMEDGKKLTAQQILEGEKMLRHYGRPVHIAGLNLLPYNFAAQIMKQVAGGSGLDGTLADLQPSDRKNREAVAERLSRLNFGSKPSDTTTLCPGASLACMSTCLVFAGQNWSSDGPVVRKAIFNLAIRREPVAFARLLHRAITLRSSEDAAAGLHTLVRLNYLSDVVWEEFYPWLHAAYDPSQTTFYDYTKGPNRTSVENYDLTFSFSGTNERYLATELARGHRAAVVFLGILPSDKMRPLGNIARPSARRGGKRAGLSDALPEEDMTDEELAA